MNFEVGKEYQTARREKAICLATGLNLPRNLSCIFACTDCYGKDYIIQTDANGRRPNETGGPFIQEKQDLVEVKAWVNVFREPSGAITFGAISTNRDEICRRIANHLEDPEQRYIGTVTISGTIDVNKRGEFCII